MRKSIKAKLIRHINKKEFWVSCFECNIETSHKIWSQVNVFKDFDVEDYGPIQGNEEYMIIQCNGCHEFSFCSESTSTEDCVPDDNGNFEYYVTTKLYPNRITGRPKMKDVIYLPYEIRVVYEETHSALCAGQRVLTGIGLRAIIESVCKDQKAKGTNLKIKIGDLVRKEFITNRSAKILQDLRFMGNKSAHEVKAHSTSTLKIALDIVEHLLKEIYILPKIAEDLNKKK